MTETQNLEKYQPLIFAVALGIIGALVNSLSFPFLPQVQLIFGNAAFVIVAMRLKPHYALLCALITVFPLMSAWGHPFGFITFGLEALFISYARSKGTYVLFSDILYWLLIGMPLTALLIWLPSPSLDDYWLFITLKQGVNAALYTSIATIILFLFDHKITSSAIQQPPTNRSLLKQLMHSIVLVTSFALISSSLFISRNLISDAIEHIDSTLKVSASHFADTSNQFIESQSRIINLASFALSSQPKQQHQASLDNILANSHFNNMLITDKQGVLQYSSPEGIATNNTETRSIADRGYFQAAITEKQLYISPIFQGRGIGQDPIVAMSAPIMRGDEAIGVVSGSLIIGEVSKLTEIKFDNEHVELVLVDPNNKIMYSSPKLELTPLTQFNIEVVNDPATLPLLRIHAASDTAYAYQVKTLTNQWEIYTLINNQLIVNDIERQYLEIFINLIITLIIAVMIAILLGRRLTQALNFIIRKINQSAEQEKHDRESFQPLYGDASIEIRQLYEEFKANKKAMKEYQYHLEEKVEQRTKELHDANEKLKLLTLIDGLTKVHNRRYLSQNFEYIQKSAQRNTALMAVVMLDLDHFKRLNDKHGHLAGDDCLVRVAEVMSAEFSRETDTVIRYGGEEFLILAPYVTVAALKQKLENLRLTIASQIFLDPNSKEFSVTASMGALIADADFSTDIIKWIKHADACLYQAKDSGRNKVVIEDRISRAD